MMRKELDESSAALAAIAHASAMGIPAFSDESLVDDIAKTHANAHFEINQSVNEDEESLSTSLISRLFLFIGKRLVVAPLMQQAKQQIIFASANIARTGLMLLGLAGKVFGMMLSTAVTVISTLARCCLEGIKFALQRVLASPIGIGAFAVGTVGYALYRFFARKDQENTLATNSDGWIQLNDDDGWIQLTDGTAADVSKDIFKPEVEIYNTMRTEGWDKIFSDGQEYSKFGITSNKHRSRDFVKSLTPEQAYQIYKRDYWDAAGVEHVPEELQRVYFNTAVNMGISAAKSLLRESGGTLSGFVSARNKRYRQIARRDSFKRKYLKGWLQRSQNEYESSIEDIQRINHNRELVRYGKTLGAA